MTKYNIWEINGRDEPSICVLSVKAKSHAEALNTCGLPCDSEGGFTSKVFPEVQYPCYMAARSDWKPNKTS